MPYVWTHVFDNLQLLIQSLRILTARQLITSFSPCLDAMNTKLTQHQFWSVRCPFQNVTEMWPVIAIQQWLAWLWPYRLFFYRTNAVFINHKYFFETLMILPITCHRSVLNGCKFIRCGPNGGFCIAIFLRSNVGREVVQRSRSNSVAFGPQNSQHLVLRTDSLLSHWTALRTGNAAVGAV